jgi:hypothetical protein
MKEQFHAYDQWRTRLVQAIGDYRAWLEKFRLTTPESTERIERCLAGLESDQFTVAFVAEFSRGKTELINALFFADYGRRLLPSTAGRTTMCPTELFYDHEAERPYVRLLPIETRLQDIGLLDLKKDVEQWVTYPLDLASPAQVEDTLREVVRTRRVTLEEAVRLGMYNPDNDPHRIHPITHVDIPRWRHALISFPHPLLKQGLTILDTPGLNALGSEPELTVTMLPSAQSVLFLLAADTGVTRTDLDIWQHHIKGFHSSRRRGLMVVLNKTDTLWDDLAQEDSVGKTIDGQCASSAKILGIDKQNIFPVSAKMGLQAKIQGDDALLRKSELNTLDQYLSDTILNSRRQIVQETVTADVSDMLQNSYSLVATKLQTIKKQLNELQQLSGKSREVVEHMLEKTREEQAAYVRAVNSFQASRKVLMDQSKILRDTLDMTRLEQKIKKSWHNMSGNWTTIGLKSNMRVLMDSMRQDMQTVVDEAEQARKLIRSIHRRFQEDYGFVVTQPTLFTAVRRQADLDQLAREAEKFRKSPFTAITEKHFVVKHFFVAMVARARDVFFQTREEADHWLESSLEPLTQQIKEHRTQMEHYLLDLKKINSSRDTLQTRINELQGQQKAATRQLLLLRNLHGTLNDEISTTVEQESKPRLISQGPTT